MGGQRATDKNLSGRIKEEFYRSPVQFVINSATLIAIIIGALSVSVRYGVFKEQWHTIQTCVAEIKSEVKFNYEANAAEHKRIERAITIHTGKPVE